MASNVVYAKSSTVLAHAGQRIAVRAWEPWDAGDPLVQHYPDMFTANLEAVRSTADPRGYAEVEQATRAPGEKRNVRRAPRTGGEAGKTGA